MTTGTEVATRNQDELDLIKAQQAELEDIPFRVPILKIGQYSTREVKAGDAEAGEFINTLTGQGLGDKVDFIVAYCNKGRFASQPKTNRAFTSFDKIIPESWADFVGEEFVGTPFSEHPDAEERYKERANAKEIEWGSGPPISTTHNYTGFVIADVEEGSDDEPEYSPVRLSLKRGDRPAIRKFTDVQRHLRNRPFYDIVFTLTTYAKTWADDRETYLLNPKMGRKTTAEEKQMALQLAKDVHRGLVLADDDALVEAPAEPPKVEGALEV